MKCNHCGKEFEGDQAVCPFCNLPVNEETDAVGREESARNEERAASEEKKDAAEEKNIAVEEPKEKETEGLQEEADEVGSQQAEANNQKVEADNQQTEAEISGIGEALSDVKEAPPVRSKAMGKIAALLVGAVVLAGAGTFAASKMMEKDPKEVVIQAFENVYTDDQEKPLEELFGLAKFRENGAKASQETSMQFMLESSSDEEMKMLEGAGIRVEARQDRDEEKASVNLGILYNHMDLVNLDLYYGEETLMASVPEMSGRVFTLDVSEGLAERVAESEVLAPMLEDSGVDVAGMSEFFSEYVDWLEEQTKNAADPDTLLGIYGLWNRYKKGCQAQEDLKAVLTVEKAEKANFQMDGKEVPCRGYQVHVSKDAMISFLRTSSDFFLQDEELRRYFLDSLEMSSRMAQLSGGAIAGNPWEELSIEEQLQRDYEELGENVDETIDRLNEMLSDADMMVYVDKKGRLAAVDGEIAIVSPYGETDQSYKLAFEINLRGGSFLTQNAWAKAELVRESDGESVTLEMTKTGEYDGKKLAGNWLFDLRMPDKTPITLELNGSYDSDAGDFSLLAALGREDYGFFEASLNGVVSELQKGTAIHLDMDEIRLSFEDVSQSGSFDLTISGEYDLRPLSGEVTEPEGKKLDIVTATEDDWEQVSLEMYFSLVGLLGRLQN